MVRHSSVQSAQSYDSCLPNLMNSCCWLTLVSEWAPSPEPSTPQMVASVSGDRNLGGPLSGVLAANPDVEISAVKDPFMPLVYIVCQLKNDRVHGRVSFFCFQCFCRPARELVGEHIVPRCLSRTSSFCFHVLGDVMDDCTVHDVCVPQVTQIQLQLELLSVHY